MSLETETILDRRHLRRRLTWWRGVALGALLLAIGALVATSTSLEGLPGQNQIARVAIEGTIGEDRDQLAMLRRIKDTASVDALIVYVNSPGGTTAGGEGLYEALREIAKVKPVVAQFGTVAASAGYIVGLGTDYIVARGNSITGSVGVIAQWPEVAQLLDKLGVKVNEVKSGSLKATPSPFQPMDEPGRQVMQDMIDDGFAWFIGLVEDRRGVRVAEVPGLKEGRVFSGRQALKQKLIDEIGGEPEAKRWLEDKRGVAKDLKIVTWKPTAEGGWGVPGASSGWVAGLLGEGPARLMNLVAKDPSLSTLGLDGLVSIWHPSEK